MSRHPRHRHPPEIPLRDERNLAVANEQRANAVSEFLVNTLTQANPYAPQKGAVSVLEAMDHAAATLNENLDSSPDLRRQLRATIGNVYMNLDEAKRCLDLLGAEQAGKDLSGATPVDQARIMILHSECHLARDERDASWRWLESADRAGAGIVDENPGRDPSQHLVRSGDVAAARTHLAAADDSVNPPGKYEGWLQQEHTDIVAMIEAAR